MTNVPFASGDQAPGGCQHCGAVQEQHHSRTYPFFHRYVTPDDATRLARMKQRRAAAIEARGGE